MYFIKIKPNSDKYIDCVLADNMLRLLNMNDFNLPIESNTDMIDLIEDYIVELSMNDPIQFINSYFASINCSDLSMQYYDILTINKTDDKYNLLLVNNNLNIPSMISEFTDTFREKNFNLIASSLSQYYNNSVAIFGDVFLININKDYYDILENINNIKQKDNNNNDDINDLELVLSKYKNIYYDYKYYNLFNSMTNIYYVNIYVQPLNKKVIYSRGILNNIIQKYVSSNKLNIINSNIIQIFYSDMIMFIKIDDILPNSHNHIVLMIGDISDNYYLTNILNNDIEILLKNIA